MTTRAKRSAKSPQIEARLGSDRLLLKELVKASLQEVLEAEMSETLGARPRRAHGGPRGVSVRLLQPGAGDADREAGAAGPPAHGRPRERHLAGLFSRVTRRCF